MRLIIKHWQKVFPKHYDHFYSSLINNLILPETGFKVKKLTRVRIVSIIKFTCKFDKEQTMQLKKPKITVVGSYVVGITIRAPRFPVAGETLIGREFDLGPGGKGSNQAIGATRLGAETQLLVKLGQDNFGDSAVDLYKHENMSTTYVTLMPDADTGVALITLNEVGENHIIIYPGANDLLLPEDVDAMEDEISRSDVVMSVLEIKPETAGRAMALGRKHGVLTILNPAPAQALSKEILRNVDVITPNETELKILLGLAPDENGDVKEMAKALQTMGVRNIVVTQGGSGVLIVDETGKVSQIPGIQVSVVDTTGAGDAFNAALATALGEGKTLLEATKFAAVAGGLCCTKLGVIPALPTREMVEAKL